MSVVLDFKSVTKRFGVHAALDSVSFHVNQGEVLALLGDNGAGKSTVVNCIAGHVKPDEGEIRVGDIALDASSTTAAKSAGVGVVYQDLALFNNMSVAENLFAGSEPAWPSRPRGLGFVQKRKMLEQAKETLTRLEVRIPNLSTPVGLLSGGQRQAIAVAKGISNARRLVILDEPTAALGLRERANVARMIRQLPGLGVSVVLISHNLEEVMAVADRAVVLRQGKKVGELTPTPENHEALVSMIVGASSAAQPPQPK